MIKTKAELIKNLEKLGDMKITQGIMYKELSYSIKQYQNQKPLKEWLKLVNDRIELEGGLN